MEGRQLAADPERRRRVVPADGRASCRHEVVEAAAVGVAQQRHLGDGIL